MSGDLVASTDVNSGTATLGDGVRYVRTTYVPEDEVVLHLFEAPSAEALRTAGRTAALEFERIVEAQE